MDDNLKKTPYGLIPSTWSYTPLRSIVDRITEKNANRSENVLTISAKDGLVNQRNYFNKSVASKDLSKYVYLRKGDFAYNKSYSNGFPYGAIKRLEKYPIGIVSTLYICFRNNSDCVDNEFLKHLFDSPLWHAEVRVIAKEGGRAHGLLNIGINEFFNIMLPFPPKKEQQKIAAILSSVDDAIDKSEQIIEQTERVKQGLMQQLLTRGIGHTQFKQTEIGKMPTEWELKSVEETMVTTSGGTPSRQNSDYYNGNIPWIKTGELKHKYIYSTKENISNSALKESSAKLLPSNSVILAMYGATMGNVSITKIESTCNQACCAFLPNSKLSNEFLYYFLSFSKTRIITLSAGGAQPNISQKIIKKLKLPLPPLEEQKEIANILLTIDNKIDNEKRTLKQLSFLKDGLMQQLLTGKVRVPVDENEVISQ